MIYTSNCILSKVVSSKNIDVLCRWSFVLHSSIQIGGETVGRWHRPSLPLKTRLRVIKRFSFSVDRKSPLSSITSGSLARAGFIPSLIRMLSIHTRHSPYGASHRRFPACRDEMAGCSVGRE